MSEFNFNCPQCGERLSANDEWRGMQTECPHCSKAIMVPEISKPEPAKIQLKPLSKRLAADEKSCPKCGQTIKKTAVFCRYCKNSIQEEATASAPGIQLKKLAATNSTQRRQRDMVPGGKNNFPTWMIVAIAGGISFVFLLFIVIVALLVAFNPDRTGNSIARSAENDFESWVNHYRKKEFFDSLPDEQVRSLRGFGGNSNDRANAYANFMEADPKTRKAIIEALERRE